MQNTESLPRAQIPHTVIEAAVRIARRRLRGVRKSTAMRYADREILKTEGWQRLHEGHIAAGAVAAILVSWGHRELSQGNRAPNAATLAGWAGEIADTIHRAQEARNR